VLSRSRFWSHVSSSAITTLTLLLEQLYDNYPTDPADLFAVLYDSLPERLFALDGEAEDWLVDDAVSEIAALVEGEVAQSGRLSSDSLERFAVDVDQEERGRFAVMLGLDRAMEQLDLTAGTPDSGPLVELELRYLELGRLNTEAVAGAVLPKIVSPAQEHLLPESLREAFSAVIRVPADSAVPVRHHVNPDAWIRRGVRDGGLFVGVMPAFDRVDPLIVERVDGSAASAYRLRLEDTGNERDWVEQRLTEIDQSGAQIVVLPEVALTPPLLAAWQTAMRASAQAAGRAVRWVVVGSGPERDDEGERPHNRAVVLDRASGSVVWQQDKQFRFQLESNIIRRWGLEEQLGEGPLEEWITPGAELVVVETPGIRLAIAICEDLEELDTVGAAARDWGVSHLLVPIFSQKIRRHRWEDKSAGWLLQHGGIRTVVVNSHWVGDVDPQADEEPVDALAVADETLPVAIEPTTGIAVFRFTADGVFLVGAAAQA
jgi:predicted amidohydrolase